MKNTIFSHTTTCNSLIFYRLMQDERIIHLTFDHLRHQKTIKKLRETSFQILRTPTEEIQTKTLKGVLTKNSQYNKFSQSIFIKQGTSFQQQVWALISQIPLGTTQTYGQLAEKLGNRKLARAVGQACNANPLALIIPCHRVVGIAGLGGFAGGVENKDKLLQFEREWAFKR